MIGFNSFEQLIETGSLPPLSLNFAPNFDKGIITLFISLFFRDLSPVTLIFFFESIKIENNIIKKYSLDPSTITEDELFNKKIFKRSKGSLKLLNIGEPNKSTNLEISYASKKAVEVLEKLGGKIKLTKK